MTIRTLFPALLAPCLLAACVDETVIPAADAPRPDHPAQASAPPPVTEFDGTYVGKFTLNPDRTRACPQAPGADRTLTVTKGRATLLMNPRTRYVLTGTVGQAGDLRVSDILDRTIATSGTFSDGRFLGEHRNGLCSYAVIMSKQGG
ncbi:hypothetical protein [Roseicella frigidaeris]|uniref:Uncharacterized protein n=1 Tax=Roseicella frigidaeris TaxID=2230885 RepID=A0A327M9Q2_9PROT|nr:hypothetical protein [Roseicella frigidaeris]RAI58853.1 hypothetical protein DOO78_12335 [Roseicella frigidaeris]